MDEDSVVFDKVDKESTCDYPFSELSFFNNNEDTYILLHNYEAIDGNTIEQINNVAYSAGIRPIFRELDDCMSFFAGGRAPLINGEMSQEADGKVESYVNINLSANEMMSNLVAYSNHEGTVILEISSGDDSSKTRFIGPFVSVIDSVTMNFQAKFFTPRGSMSNPNDVFELYTVDSDNLGAFASRINKFNKSFVVSPANDGTTLYTVMTGRNFDRSIRVRVDGKEVETVDINGKLCFLLNPNIESVVEISTYNQFFIYYSFFILSL